MKYLNLVLVLAVLCFNTAYAADIAEAVRTGTSGPEDSDGGYFELGIGLNTWHIDGEDLKAGFAVYTAGAYRYRGFFIEAVHGSTDGVNLGYNLWNNRQWSIDVLGASVTSVGKLGKPLKNANSPDARRENAVLNRDITYIGAGIRLTRYFDNVILQYRLVSDIHGNGITSTARLGYSRQIKNWNFHSILSARFVSQETSRYLYGIAEDEASMRYPEYDLGSTIQYAGEIGLSYPLAQNLVFRTTGGYVQFDNDVANSPVQDGNGKFSIRLNSSISYVF